MSHDDVRLTLERPDGEVRVAIRSAVTEGAQSYVVIGRYDRDNVARGAVAFRAEELDRLEAALRECRRLLLGLPGRVDAGADEVLGRRRKSA